MRGRVNDDDSTTARSAIERLLVRLSAVRIRGGERPRLRSAGEFLAAVVFGAALYFFVVYVVL